MSEPKVVTEDIKRKSRTLTLGAESVTPLTTIPNLPTQNSSYKQDDYIFFGEDNKFPYYLTSLQQISPTHQAAIDYKTNAIVGKEVVISGDYEKAALNYNPKDYQRLIKMTAPELATFEAFPFVLITNQKGQVVQIQPLPTDSIRSGDYEGGEIKNYYYSQNWAEASPKIEKIPAWNPFKKGGRKGRFLAYQRIIKAGQYFYTIPSYYSAWRYITIEDKMGEFHHNYISNGMFPSVLIELFGQQAEEEAVNNLESGLKQKFTGKGASKILILQNDDPDNKTNITSFNLQDLPNYFNEVNPASANKILTAHKISPLLIGVKEKGTTGLGSNSEEIQASAALFDSNTVLPMRLMITDLINDIHAYNGDDVEVEIIPNTPDFDYEAVKGKRNDLPEAPEAPSESIEEDTNLTIAK